MNIFRVLASGKHRMREEMVSAMLGYLLSPQMDHGLGIRLMKGIVESLIEKEGILALSGLRDSLYLRFRSDLNEEKRLGSRIQLEVPYKKGNGSDGAIDVVIELDDWFVVIENKINKDSKTDEQVKEEYNGFRQMIDVGRIEKKRILFLYVVPAVVADSKDRDEENWQPDIEFEAEAQGICSDGDVAAVVYWQDIRVGAKNDDELDEADDDRPRTSVTAVIRGILDCSDRGLESPISWELRQTLLSLVNFAHEQFLGYPYDRVTERSRPERMKLRRIFESEETLYLGVWNGFAGLVVNAWRDEGILEREFNVSPIKLANYISASEAKALFEWACRGSGESLSRIDWQGSPFFTDIMYLVAKDLGPGISIGVRGGIKALASMSEGDIRGKPGWPVSAARPNPWWFGGDEFCKVLEGKGIRYSAPDFERRKRKEKE